jgi:hypothetical protein
VFGPLFSGASAYGRLIAGSAVGDSNIGPLGQSHLLQCEDCLLYVIQLLAKMDKQRIKVDLVQHVVPSWKERPKHPSSAPEQFDAQSSPGRKSSKGTGLSRKESRFSQRTIDYIKSVS